MVAACHTATGYFNLWLKATGYSVVKTNVLPTAGNAVAIVVTLLWGVLADRTGQRFILITSLLVLMMISNILLSVWDLPKGALMFAFYSSYAGAATTPVLIVSSLFSSNFLVIITKMACTNVDKRHGVITSTPVTLICASCSSLPQTLSPTHGCFGYHVS
jgi:MFS family permease